MAKLDGLTVLVAGGAGIIGSAITRALLHEGARVAVPSREPKKLERLHASLPLGDATRLLALAGDIGDADGAERLRDDLLARVDALDAVVAALGGWWGDGPLVGVSPEDWARVLANNLTAHFVAARSFLPVIADRAGSSYTLIGGSTTLAPEPDAGVMSITGAAQLMLMRVLSSEFAGRRVRINEVIFGPVVTPEREPPIKPEWLTGEEAGAFVCWLVSHEAAMVHDSVLRLLQRPARAGGDA